MFFAAEFSYLSLQQNNVMSKEVEQSMYEPRKDITGGFTTYW